MRLIDADEILRNCRNGGQLTEAGRELMERTARKKGLKI